MEVVLKVEVVLEKKRRWKRVWHASGFQRHLFVELIGHRHSGPGQEEERVSPNRAADGLDVTNF